MSTNDSQRIPQSQPTARIGLCLLLGGLIVNGCVCGEPPLERLPEPHIVLEYETQRSPDLERLDINLGAVAINSSSRIRFSILNTGDADLEVSDIVIAPSTECPIASPSIGITVPTRVGTLRPTTVPAQESETADPGEVEVEINFSPSDGAPACATVYVYSADEDYPERQVLLRGQGDIAQLCVDQTDHDFGDVNVGESAEHTFTLNSCGTRPVTIVSLTENEQFPPFGVTLPPLPLTLAAGDTYPLPVTFSPTEARAYTYATQTAGEIFVVTDELGYQLGLTGRGVLPPSCQLNVNPTLVQFGNVGEGRQADQEVIIRNLGDLDCNVSGAEVLTPAGSFSVNATTLPATLAPNDAVSVTASFSPAVVSGVENATLRVSSNDPLNPEIDIPLEGTSIELQPCALEATPTAVNFGSRAIGETHETTLVLTNIGTERCLVRSVEKAPGGSPAFAVDAELFPVFGFPVDPGETVDALVTFTPLDETPAMGSLIVEYKEFGLGNPDQTFNVPLLGQGLSPAICVTPLALDFGTVATGSTGVETTLVTNCGPVDLTVRGLDFITGTHPGYSVDSSPALPFVLAPGDGQSIGVKAAPTTANTASSGTAMFGALSVLSADVTIPAVQVSLTANADACISGLACTPLDVQFGGVDVGLDLVRSVSCFNPGTQNVTLTPAVTGPFSIVQGPSSIAPQTTGVFTLRYTPTGVATDSGVFTPGATTCAGGPIEVNLHGEGIEGFLPDCPTPQTFSPEVVWHWEGGSTMPNSNHVWTTPLISRLEDTDGDGVVTRDDTPRVVFISFNNTDSDVGEFNDPTPGVLRAVDGNTGAEVFTVTDPAYRLNSGVTPAIADINGDGFVEIIASMYVLLEGTSDIPGGPEVNGKFTRGRLMAFRHDGSFLWQSDQWTRDDTEIEDMGAIAVADMDLDGLGEIAVGDHVFDHNGHLLFKGGEGTGSASHGPVSAFAQMDGDPELELVCGTTVYNHDGTVLWSNATIDSFGYRNDGLFAVADLDNNGTNEIVLRNREVRVLNGQTGATLHGPMTPPTQMGHGYECEPPADPESEEDCNPIPTNPAIMDIDGDGDLEILVSNTNVMMAYDHTLGETWRAPVSDQTGASGPIGFDFENDGNVNPIYSDEGNVWVFTPTGQPIYDAARSSVTLMETASVGDINLDGHANMVVGSNEPLAGLADGLDMLTNTGTSWAHARPMWNQHAYVEGLVGELGQLYTPSSLGSIKGYRIATPACVP